MNSNQPIRRQLMTVILLTSGAVVLLTCTAFVAYEWVAFRRELVGSLTTLAQITADNTTAALAFENESDAKEVLSALRIERNVVAACLYDKDGKLFARYPANEPAAAFPSAPEKDGHRFTQAHLILFQPVGESGQRLGTLYLRSNVSAMYERFQLYAAVAVLVMAISCLVALVISAALQRRISQPILALADTAKAISDRRDYSVRARKVTQDELGLLTDAFNQMLNQIQAQDSALRASEARKGAILGSALDAIITIDHRGMVVEFNPAAERIFGHTRDQVIGKEMADTIIPPSLRERHRQGMAHYLATGEGPVLGRRLELTALRADGTEFPVELAITRIGSEDPPTFTGFLRDITERKRAEERLRVVVAAAPNAMLMVGEDGRIAMVNLQAEKLFGYDRPELLGQAIEMLVPERFRAAHPGMREGFFAAPQRRAMGAGRDLYGLRKDGSEVPIEIGLSPITTAEGRFVLASIVDITERKKAEERLHRFNAELEERVEQRTAELHLSEERLRTALHDKEALLQEIHHRVKNNLQVIASVLSLQSGYIRDPQMLAQFQASQGRIHSMALIHEKLYGSESLAWVDLADYVQNLVSMLLRTYATNANVKLDVRVDPAAVTIDTAVPVGLVLNELVTNALKYAFPDGRKGCLLVALEAKPNEQFEVRVEDDGVGLGPDFQLDQAKTLGLRLVRMFAKQLRAEVTFRSGSGHTAFNIRFQEQAAKSP